MEVPPIRILVYGAGVIGSLYAARLKDAGHDVVLLARGRRLNELETHGIVLQDEATGRMAVTRVTLTDHLDPTDRYDLIVVTMRKGQVESILTSLAANTVTPTVLFMVNNGAGPDRWVEAVGRGRVVLGFPGAGGGKDGPQIRYQITSPSTQPTTLGELNGRVTPRLQAIRTAFQQAGFPTELSPNMDAWLCTHVALVVPIANALRLHGGDNYALAKSPEDLRLLVQGVQEGFAVLQALGIALVPSKMRLLRLLPAGLLVPILRRVFATSWAELVLARHARTAADEMKDLSVDLMELVAKAGATTPALARLHSVTASELYAPPPSPSTPPHSS